MKLVASMIVAPSEADRYLYPCLDHLGAFCDEVVVMFDTPADPVIPLTEHQTRHVFVPPPQGVTFYGHEGRARQALLDATMAREPTHILAIDADEFVTDGSALREAVLDDGCPTWVLQMHEVWQATTDLVLTREDGGWRTHGVPVLYRVPDKLDRTWRIPDRQLASGRVPQAVSDLFRRDCTQPCGSDLLHFGWTNEAERVARHQRYVEHDGGRFHNRAHLDSILWDDRRVTLRSRPWPPGLDGYRDAILARALPPSLLR